MKDFGIEELRELAKIVRENGLCSLEITDGDRAVKLTAGAPGAAPAPIPAAPGAVPGSPISPGPGEGFVTSPVVGVFYRAPSPEAEPFVQVGSQVGTGDVLCVVEAMKLMNEITAEFPGEVVEILAENGEVVDFGRPLFRIKEQK